MIFFLQDKDYISRLHARCLVSLPSKSDFLAVLHAFVHMYLQNLHLLHDFLALTFFTTIFLVNNFTWSGLTKQGQMCVKPKMTQKSSITFDITGHLPSPLQSVHTDCICWTIPGANCLIMTRIPRPRHVAHFCTEPVLPPCLQSHTRWICCNNLKSKRTTATVDGINKLTAQC